MRQFMPITMAVGAVAALLIVSFIDSELSAQAQFAHCMPARGCVPTTQASYNACYQLARRLVWNDSDNSRRGGLGSG